MIDCRLLWHAQAPRLPLSVNSGRWVGIVSRNAMWSIRISRRGSYLDVEFNVK